ncbi:guanine nucleotide-binding protein alpha-4 subunit [Laccaria bicolor S238N-H82]|uniref:Guanine nucleotide-binding protein alpha-4 subunit n=1 Tax=Laccaria bicolor (strain S238N-H82 / ATCC MYA-4686) TaxID=486041 RepID=B0DRQ2_LACBS|nr:guanine nucleotide-binding protein alpha-4 subunit [Laccaria bicolor S238N-H82]EDR02573.1 guanine nucleotide-binding protein alpha-4 subunit [Laccaria bicolor S238N-H82]|eukprot:XP_001886617.1 guanine nucleotide-binding protein alpha-4 subunit [Laccaria bicolor S238N-H82]
MFVQTTDDPLDEVLKPPPDESPEHRAIRLQNEAEAKSVSLAIDAGIKAELHARRKKRIVRLLLLGQSESGKSTTLRQFQRLYTPTAFREERILWRAVIQLNIVRSIRTILNALTFPSTSRHTSPYSSPRSRAHTIFLPPLPNHPPLPSIEYELYNGNGNDTTLTFGSSSPTSVNRHPHHHSHSPPSNPDSDADSESDFVYPHQHGHYPHRSPPSNPSITLAPTPGLDALKARLLPLRHIEALLIAKLVPPNEEEATYFARVGAGSSAGASSSTRTSTSNLSAGSGYGTNHRYRNQEIFVRPGPGWKGGLARAIAGNTGLETQDEPQEVLNMCRSDIIALWHDEGVREVLRRRKIRLEEGSGFFLDDLERLTSLKYMPTDDDVLKARLKTVGASEYKFEMEATAGRDSGTEWRIVDTGGSRSQRPTWAPFFDDVDAIIFLAPISGFDQVLSEDRTVNRLFDGMTVAVCSSSLPFFRAPWTLVDTKLLPFLLPCLCFHEDSILLWKAVCSNKLLANVDLVLLLNKCDILEKKLKLGIQVSKYIRSYGDRKNDLDSVSKYLRNKFSAIHRQYSPNPRKFYAFFTSVTDTATTAGIIASVRDMVFRQTLKQSKLL